MSALLSGMGVVTVLVCLVSWYFSARPVQAQVAGEQQTISEGTKYSLISALRKELSLTNDDLAAMGCSEKTAQTVLESLVIWYSSNVTQLERALKEEALKLEDVRDAQKRVNTGPRDEALLAQYPGLARALSDAVGAHRELVATAVSSIEAQLSADQRGVWETIRKNKGGFGSYRYAPDLTDDQVHALGLAWRSRSRNLMKAGSSGEQSAVMNTLKKAEGDILSFGQREAMVTAESNARNNAAGVLKASSKVLPLPEELRPEILSVGQ